MARVTRIATIEYDFDPEVDEPPDWDYVFEGRTASGALRVLKTTDKKKED